MSVRSEKCCKKKKSKISAQLKKKKKGTTNLINPDLGLAFDKSLCGKGNIPLIFNSFAVKFY